MSELTDKDSELLRRLFDMIDPQQFVIDVNRKAETAGQNIVIPLKDATAMRHGNMAPIADWLPSIFKVMEDRGTPVSEADKKALEAISRLPEEVARENDPFTHTTDSNTQALVDQKPNFIDLTPYLGEDVETISTTLKRNKVFGFTKNRISQLTQGEDAPSLREIGGLVQAYPEMKEIETDLRRQATEQVMNR